MDKFLQKKYCDRCGKILKTRIMSKMNTDTICMACLEEERQHPLYKEASDAELEAVKRGNYNYQGLFSGQKYPFIS